MTRRRKAAGPAKVERSARSVSKTSTIGCVGVCGYLIGVALPLSPPFDLPLAFLVVLATFAAVTGGKQPNLSRSVVAVIAVLGFIAARLVSSLAAPDALGSLQRLAPFLPALLLFFVLSEWVETRHHIIAICVSLTAAGFVLATTLLTVSWLSDTSDADAWAQAVPSPMLVVKNDITVVAVLAPLALTAASLRPRRLVRVIVVGFFASLITVIGVVQSRTALLTTVVAIVAFAALSRGRGSTRRRRILLMLVGLVAVAVAGDALVGFRFAHKVMHDWQGSGRLALWVAALAMFRDAPLLGHGPNSFALHYRAYLDALQLPAWIHVDPRVTPWAHNLYLELLAEQGAVGLAAFLALGAVGLSMANRITKSPHRDLHSLGAAAGAAFIAFLTAAALELSFIRAWVTIMLFTLLGILTTLTRSAREAGPCETP